MPNQGSYLLQGICQKVNIIAWLEFEFTYEVHTISFQTLFVWAFKIVVNSWKLSMLLLYILWDDWPIFMISGSNEQLQQELLYTLPKPDCHIWWMAKMQSDNLEERYAIKFCFKLGKMPQKHMKGFRLLFEHLAWIDHQFLSGIRDSRKAGSLWGIMRGEGGVRKSTDQSWLAKGLGLGLLCWGSSGSVSLGKGQHSSNRVSGISTRTMHQSTTTSLSLTIWPRWASTQFPTLPIVHTFLLVTFGYSLSSEAVVMRQLRKWKRLWRRLLTRSLKTTSMGRSRSCWNGIISPLQPEVVTSKRARVSCGYYR